MYDELRSLSNTGDFGAWNVDRYIDGQGNIMETQEDLIQQHCPTLLFLLDRLCRPRREAKDQDQRKRPIRRFVVIISIILFCYGHGRRDLRNA